MRNISKAVSPFYDQGPGAPTPFPSMLTDQLELRSNNRPTTLVADEILAPKASPIISAARASTNSLVSKFTLAKQLHRTYNRFGSPYPMRVARTRSQSTVLSNSPACSIFSLDSDSSVPLSKNSKIPKPPGEPGRPGRGGYKLYNEMNWSPKEYAKFKVRNVFIIHFKATRDALRNTCMTSSTKISRRICALLSRILRSLRLCETR